MPVERADILVLGLGPAGASAAAEAARAGCRVIALERKREPGRPVQCAEFVPLMIGMEVARPQQAVLQSVTAMRTYIEGNAPDLKAPFPGHMLDRSCFDAMLVSEAARLGAQCRLNTHVRGITPEGHVVLARGQRLAATVIIGADGPRSVAGKAISAVNRELVETRQITVPLLEPQHTTDIFLARNIVGGYGWLFPKGDSANLGAGVAPEFRSRLKDIVAGLHRRLQKTGRVGSRVLDLTGGLIPVGGMLKPVGRMSEVLVLLAGDALGLANPVTGAGIAAAVHSGRLAGQAAARAIRGDGDAALAYEEELVSLYGAALKRARQRRHELAVRLQASRGVERPAWRRGWIAYPEYWAV